MQKRTTAQLRNSFSPPPLVLPVAAPSTTVRTSNISHASVDHPFMIYYQNVRGLRTKTNNLFLALTTCDYDVVVFTETWLKDDIKNSELSNSYLMYRCDRNLSTSHLQRGGGVLIGVKNKLNSMLISVDDNIELEQCIVRIKLRSYSLYICTIYLPPNSEPALYKKHAACVQQMCSQMGDEDRAIVVGDYNLPYLSWTFDDELGLLLPMNASSEQEIAFVESLISTGLAQINTVCNANNRTLDLMFINDSSCMELFQAPLPLLKEDSHHPSLVLKLEVLNAFNSHKDNNFNFDFNRCDVDLLNLRLREVEWHELLNGRTIDEAVAEFYGKVFGIIRQVVPVKNRAGSLEMKQPWWNNRLTNLRNRLRKARTRYFSTRSITHKDELRDIEGQYNSLRVTSFRGYIRQIEVNIKENSKSFWTFINNRKQSKGIPQNIRYKQTSASSSTDAANLFSSFFQSVLSNNSPPLSESYLSELPQYSIHLPSVVFSHQDILSKLQATDASKSCGPDHLPPAFIRKCAESLAVPVTMIFNRSLTEGCFPTAWKTAAITPVYKSGNVHDVENYRGISILSCLPKIFESLLLDAVYLPVQQIISSDQHGFMRKRSTTTNLLTFATYLFENLEKRQQVDAIYVDFSKAFDKVPHALAIEKLNRMGFPNWFTRWMESYLTGRSAYVRLGATLSSPFGIESGVPQGSHLGPLLFVLFINDLCAVIKSPKLMFADDLKFYRVVSTLVDCCALQTDLNSLLRWCVYNGMEVNIGKCSTISFCRSRNPIVFSYTISSTALSRVNVIRDLGILFDSKLTFNDHIASTCAKAFAMIGFIKRNTQSFEDVHCLMTLYYTLVRSILEYGVQIWAPYHAVQINRLERIQKQFLRYALRVLPWDDPAQLPSYDERSLLIPLPTLTKRRILLQRLFVFDILSNRVDCPDLLSRLRINVPPRPTRNHDFLRPAFHRTQYGQNNPFEMCCRRFNDVAEEFDFNISKHVFRLRISNR